MRVGVVSFRTVHHRRSETTERIQSLVELLRDDGHDVHVFCARWWPDDRDIVAEEGITYHGVAPDRDSGRAFLVRLPVAIRKLGADVIHVGANPPKQVGAASLGTKLSRTPVVLEWDGSIGDGAEKDYKRALGAADAIVTPSQLVRTWARERGADGDDVTVIPNPIDVDRIRAVDPGEPAEVVYARRLDEGANLESVMLALAELRDRDWTATVIGDGPWREEYESMAGDLRIDDRIRFVGEADRDERIAIYRASHVFAQTAEYCRFPTELAWALACGCVGVVEYHVDSAGHELVEGRERGFRTTSESELADAIVDAGELESLDFDDSFAEFDREAVLDRYLDCYERVQERSGLFG
ncbi:glycosyltransferase [Halovivax ruber XH-70]|uniref:Glycosyltransferase n=1 Tax=Halovivax ruber (strain DSM 18193 / JCM 13892 / XH-70) TaxID=797302 RepID=L0IDK4_HALRX|nr:glycosyltransferase family 4 protein [Halovivax ruber]AGB16913.1 glycosyltransferase [Halovivax ruber XH-70]